MQPSRIVIDALAVRLSANEDEDLEKTDTSPLRQTGQLRCCFERLRHAFPRAHFDIFAHESVVGSLDDDNLAVIRRQEPRAFHRAMRSGKSANVDRTMLVHVLSMEDGVLISNDGFSRFIDEGLVSAAWVEEHVWSFVFGRGDLVMPQLAPRHIPQQVHRGWRARHERADSARMSTALREQPLADAVPLRNQGGRILKAGPREKVSVLRVQTELEAGGEPGTWVRVACAAGTGWLKREHLKDLSGFSALPGASGGIDTVTLEVGQNARHERTDRPDMMTALRESPGLRSAQLPGVRAEARELASVLGVQTVTENDRKHTWVRIASSTGAGWLKREHLRYEPPTKRRRIGDQPEKWHCRVRSLSAAALDDNGLLSDAYVVEMKALLRFYDVGLKEAMPVTGDDGKVNGLKVVVEGPTASVEAMRAGKIVVKVKGEVAEFRSDVVLEPAAKVAAQETHAAGNGEAAPEAGSGGA